MWEGVYILLVYFFLCQQPTSTPRDGPAAPRPEYTSDWVLGLARKIHLEISPTPPMCAVQIWPKTAQNDSCDVRAAFELQRIEIATFSSVVIKQSESLKISVLVPLQNFCNILRLVYDLVALTSDLETALQVTRAVRNL